MTGAREPTVHLVEGQSQPATDTVTRMTSVDSDRLVALERVHNFRDLGGYPTADGQSVRWGVLYRSDSLGRLRAEDVELLRPLGLRTVIDLRTSDELATRGRFPVDEHPVTFHHLPILDATWGVDRAGAHDDDSATFLFDAYADMLAVGADRIASAVRVLALPGALPAVFHCAAGKDRTGILAALVLAAIGVPREHVLADYDLTNAAIARLRAWASASEPTLAAAISAAPANYMVADPRAIDRMLGVLEAEHGSVREYLRTLGVTLLELDSLRDALVTTD
jgi:protein-tyrosine phosphatase